MLNFILTRYEYRYLIYSHLLKYVGYFYSSTSSCITNERGIFIFFIYFSYYIFIFRLDLLFLMMYRIYRNDKKNFAFFTRDIYGHQILFTGRGGRTLWGELPTGLQVSKERGTAVCSYWKNVSGFRTPIERVYGPSKRWNTGIWSAGIHLLSMREKIFQCAFNFRQM